MANRKRDLAKERAWRRWISQQRRSRLSVRAFCAREQLSEPSFYAWRRMLTERQAGRKPTQTTRKRSVRPAFVSLTTPAPLTAGLFQPAATVEMIHPRGHVLRIAARFYRGTLAGRGEEFLGAQQSWRLRIKTYRLPTTWNRIPRDPS